MIVSQMMAWDGGALEEVLEEGYVAVTQTNICLVFQLKREVKSVPNQSWILGSEMETLTSVKVEFYVRIFLLFWRIVVRPAFHSANDISKCIMMRS